MGWGSGKGIRIDPQRRKKIKNFLGEGDLRISLREPEWVEENGPAQKEKEKFLGRISTLHQSSALPSYANALGEKRSKVEKGMQKSKFGALSGATCCCPAGQPEGKLVVARVTKGELWPNCSCGGTSRGFWSELRKGLIGVGKLASGTK